MRDSGLWAIWIGGVLPCLILVALLLSNADISSEDLDEYFPQATGGKNGIAFIGTSLVLHAIPQGKVSDGIIGDGRDHLVLSKATLNETDSNTSLNWMIEKGYKTIFVEAYPYVRTFNVETLQSRKSGFALLYDFQSFFREYENRLRRGYANTFKIDPLNIKSGEPPNFMDVYDGNQFNFDRLYPLHLKFPETENELKAILAKARSRGVEVIFLAMPRSQTAADFIGTEGGKELVSYLERFADRVQTRIWWPALVWPGELFKDQAHMNYRGRARFLTELAAAFGGVQ